MELRGRSAWVVGASSGIGAAVARELGARGCRVAVSARNEDRLREVAQGRMAVIPVDVTSPPSVRTAAAVADEALEGIDLAVLLAGYWRRTSSAGFDFDEFKTHVDVNVLGMAACVAAVLPGMRDRGRGVIVGVASVAGYRGLPGAEGYGTTKAAQIHLLESLRCGLRGTGVSVQTVCPGFVDTPMTEDNDFRMPFMVSAEDAATRIVEGIERGSPEVVFPWQMAMMMKAARLVPSRVWPWIAAPKGGS